MLLDDVLVYFHAAVLPSGLGNICTEIATQPDRYATSLMSCCLFWHSRPEPQKRQHGLHWS